METEAEAGAERSQMETRCIADGDATGSYGQFTALGKCSQLSATTAATTTAGNSLNNFLVFQFLVRLLRIVEKAKVKQQPQMLAIKKKVLY